MAGKNRSKSSARWLAEHFQDPYVQQAKQSGLRSRAAYKLLEIQKKDKFLKPGMVVVDLGAAPGGWSQVVQPIVGSQGTVIALDRLSMEPLPGVLFIEGDFLENSVLEALNQALADRTVDVVLSDMAPNVSGVTVADQAKSMGLVEAALQFAEMTLKPGGTFLCKVFQGTGTDDFLKALRSQFQQVKIRKPSASRDRSREVYFLALGRKESGNCRQFG